MSRRNIENPFHRYRSVVAWALLAVAPAWAQTQVQNTANVSLPPGSGLVDANPGNDTSTVTTPVVVPGLGLAKTSTVADTNGNTVLGDAGDVVTYTFMVTNTGTVALAPVTIDDAKLGLDDHLCVASLAAGATGSCTYDYTITATDVTAGSVVNVATAMGDAPGTIPDPVSTDDDTVITVPSPTASLTLAKTSTVADTNGNTVLGDAGDVVTYTFTVENTGTIALAPVTIDDAKLGLDDHLCVASLAAGATGSCTYEYTITATDVGAGSVVNTATAIGDAPGAIPDPTSTDDDTVTTAPSPTASLTLAKTSTVADTNGNTVIGDAGDVVTYTFAVANTGSVALAPVVIDDARLGLSGYACVAALAPGTSAACTYEYTITATDVAAGSVVNVATAKGDAPGTIPDPISTDDDTVITAPSPTTGLTLAKTSMVADTNGNTVLGDAGDVVTYTFTVTNSGTVPLAPVTIDDAKLGLDDHPCVASLAAGATDECTYDYTIIAADIAAGRIVNVATATGDAPGTTPDPISTDDDTVTTMPSPAAGLSLAKTSSVADTNGNTVLGDAGDVATYTFTVTNTGTVALAPVTIDDAKLGLDDHLCVASLAPVTSATCIYEYTITTTDVAAGSVVNVATAIGDAPGTIPDPTSTDDDTVTTAPSPTTGLTLAKTSTVADTNGNTVIADAGDVVTYTFTVANTGTVTLAPVTIDDAKLGLDDHPCVASLAAGATGSCTYDYTITAADVTAGSVVNTATAIGDAPGTIPDPISTDDDTVTTAPSPATGLTLAKTSTLADTNGNTVLGDAGDVVTYTFTVTNTGTIALAPVTIDDAKLGLDDHPCVASLAAGATGACSYDYTITATDMAAGRVVNVAIAIGDAPGTIPDPTSTDDDTITNAPSPTTGLTLAKTSTVADTNGNTVIGDAGDVVTYTFTVTNTGTVALAPVTIDDAKLGLGDHPCVASLAAGATGACTYDYIITATDVAAGSVVNSATAIGDAPGTIPDPTSTDDDTITTAPSPTTGLTLAKTSTVADTNGDTVIGDAGDVVTYTFTVTNTGTVALAPVTIDDAKLGLDDHPCVTSLAPGATGSCTYDYTITAADVSAGEVVNVATATGDAPGTIPDPTSTDDDTLVTRPALPAHTLAKALSGHDDVDASGTVSVGDVLTYAITLANTGNTLLADVEVRDPLIEPNSIRCASVTPGETCVLTGTYTVTAADAAAGAIRNTAVAVSPVCPEGGTDPACTATLDTPVAAPRVTYAKSADTAGPVAVGDTIAYTLSVTVGDSRTTGDVVLTDTLGTGLTLGDVAPAPPLACASGHPLVCTLPAGTLPGAYAVTYLATVNGQARGTVNNAVVATGDDRPACSGACAIDTPVVVPLTVVSKSSNPAAGTTVEVGQSIRYTLSVEVGRAALDDDVILRDTAGPGLTLGALPAGCALEAGVMTCILPAGTPVGTHAFTYTATVDDRAQGRVSNVVVASNRDRVSPPPTCASCATEHRVELPEIRLAKTAGAREARVGDLVRYTLRVDNMSTVDLVDGRIVDAPPAGFAYVEGSLQAADADGMATVAGQQPLRFEGVDVPAGRSATLVYLMRVGAGVRPGTHVNQAQVHAPTGEPVSNVATAEVALSADPMTDDSLVLGTVFNDRDGDGWQDSAALNGVQVRGGFAPGAYVAGSTTVDRGHGHRPEPDASAPLLHGIDVGAIGGRQSGADPAEARQVVIRQRLREPAFTGDFVLTSAEGVTVRMDADGRTAIEKTGEAAKGLNAAAPTVERRVAQGEGGYVVDYVIRNAGIDERGIPGVRIASVEGLLVETDPFGRYHLAGVPGGAWERGRNFILKVDPSTLPSGAAFTTDNPLLRRITPGVPVRFDFGVRLPEHVVEGGAEQVELELGEVFFAPGSAEVRPQYLPVVEAMAAKVREYRGGEVVIDANGDSEGLAFERADAIRQALLALLDAGSVRGLAVSARGRVDDPGSLVVGVDEGGALLGTVLFDTDESAIRLEFEPLLDKVAAALERMGGGSVAIVGHTDVRASHAYNVALGMRRARAVYEALARRLSQQVRANVRVEASNDPTAPVDVKQQP